MKKKILKIGLIIIAIWLFIFILDLIFIKTISKPVFMIKKIHDDYTVYYGLGYKAYDYQNDTIKIGSYFMKYNKLNIKDNEKFKKEYNNVSSNNVFVYKNINEIIDILKNGTGVVYLGFPECKWCQEYVKYLDEVANETEIDKIYYYDIYEDRQNNTKEYQELVKVLQNELDYDNEGKKRIFVPNVTFVIEGKIIANDNETAKDTKGYSEPSKYWTEKRVAALKERLSKNMEEVYTASMLCTSCNE